MTTSRRFHGWSLAFGVAVLCYAFVTRPAEGPRLSTLLTFSAAHRWPRSPRTGSPDAVDAPADDTPQTYVVVLGTVLFVVGVFARMR